MFCNVHISQTDIKKLTQHITSKVNDEIDVIVDNIHSVIYDFLYKDVVNIIFDYVKMDMICEYKIKHLKPNSKYKRIIINCEINCNHWFLFSYKLSFAYNSEKIILTLFTRIKPNFSFIKTTVPYHLDYAYLEDLLSYMNNHLHTEYGINNYLTTFNKTKDLHVILKPRKFQYGFPGSHYKPFYNDGMINNRVENMIKILNEYHLLLCVDIIHRLTDVMLQIVFTLEY